MAHDEIVGMLAPPSVGDTFDQVKLDVAHRQPSAMAIEIRSVDLMEAKDARVKSERLADVLDNQRNVVHADDQVRQPIFASDLFLGSRKQCSL
eukprot:CAMPEP_0206455118 /NCGR_PEP_ID=MMETSP0324_2-20121206/21560_1 /ASSEMBLY_ACC=CAM_ASM_000836 /TAXON_ID=2866 /ORGANISM="Crypthecodinium cohnii, Strain Seligo" /LENGTH=92 /DNA_ID=CAMNT_0053925757 /DNA_START=964 /DNA_END=1242 /DNA_ORIENTATION=-